MTWLEKAGIIVGILVPVIGACAFMLRKLWKSFKRWVQIEIVEKINFRLDKLDTDTQDRAEENALIFEGVFKIIDAIQTGEKNGNLSGIKEEMNEYLCRKIYPKKEKKEK